MHIISSKRISIRLFLELFLSLLESGISIPFSLKILSKDYKTSYYAKEILHSMETNNSFTISLCRLSKKLNSYEQILSIAEETGDVIPVLRNVIAEITDREESVKQVISILIYPFVVVSFSSVLSFVLLKYGVPYFGYLTDVSEEDLYHGVLCAALWIISAFLILIVFTGYQLTCFNFPNKFFRNLNFLTQSRISIDKSLSLLIQNDGFNNRERKIISMILNRIRNGDFLYKACSDIKKFDIYTNAWLTVVQNSGNVQECFARLYEHYSIAKRKRHETVIKFLEPGILLIIGIYILILMILCVIPVFLSLGATIL